MKLFKKKVSHDTYVAMMVKAERLEMEKAQLEKQVDALQSENIKTYTEGEKRYNHVRKELEKTRHQYEAMKEQHDAKHYEAEEQFERANRWKSEAQALRVELEALKAEAIDQKKEVKPTPAKYRKPSPFFSKVLDHICNAPDLTRKADIYYDEAGAIIGFRKNDRTYIKSDFVTEMFCKLFPPYKRVENGFHDRAIRHGVVEPSGFKLAPYLHKLDVGGEEGYYIKLTEEFVEEYKVKNVPGYKAYKMAKLESGEANV